MTSKVQRAIVGGLAAGLLVLLAACNATDAGTAGATTTPPATTSAAPPTATAANFCADLKTFWDVESQAFAGALVGSPPTGTGTAAALRLQVTKLNASAPADIRADWATVSPVFEDLAKQLEAPSADFTNKVMTYQQNQAFVAAALRLFDYTKKTCGFDASDMFGTK